MISGDVQYYKSVGCATPVATTFRLFRSFELGSVGSTFWVGSTEAFLGFPNVTKEEARAMPGTPGGA